MPQRPLFRSSCIPQILKTKDELRADISHVVRRLMVDFDLLPSD